MYAEREGYGGRKRKYVREGMRKDVRTSEEGKNKKVRRGDI